MIWKPLLRASDASWFWRFAPPDECFVVAISDGVAAACGGLRILSLGVGEIKRMYVDPALRRRGVGARVLAFLEERARVMGYSQTWLETGIEQCRRHLALCLRRLHAQSPLRRVQG
ncbi:MAG TPA: GNAT family N-acetyltransferase [Acidimicrobiales bacterium]|nr:GNAT family N-acetyltransferase [Acidimicrobiales bacterium]